MSSVMGTGPRPVSVYWRRRGMVLAGGAMGMLILFRACGGGAPEDIQRAAAEVVEQVSTYSPTPTPTDIAGVTEGAAVRDPLFADPSVTDEPTVPTSQELAKQAAQARAATEAPTATPTETATAAAIAAEKPKLTAKQAAGLAAKLEKARIAKASKSICAIDALQVTLRTDHRVYKKGEKPQLFLAVKNVSDLPCRVDLGSGALSFTIKSGNDRIWSSDDCQPKGTKDIRLLKPGQALEARSVWNGTRSAPGCPKGTPKAAPGTYVVEGKAGNATPQRRAVFTVQ
ncbi:MAG: hypothetical protein ACT4QG_07535 [Sporichthyaceae bacterium]